MLTAELCDKDGNVLAVEKLQEPRITVHFIEPKAGHAKSVVLKNEKGAVVSKCEADATVDGKGQVVSAELTLCLTE